MNVVNTTGGFILDKVVTTEFSRQAANDSEMQVMIGQFYGNFYGWQNLLGFLIQLFLVSRIFKYIGIRGALFVLPCLALGSYALFIAAPILTIIQIVKMGENSTDYSLQNTVRHALFLPTSREAKYKAKTAIDTFFWRLGDDRVRGRAPGLRHPALRHGECDFRRDLAVGSEGASPRTPTSQCRE